MWQIIPTRAIPARDSQKRTECTLIHGTARSHAPDPRHSAHHLRRIPRGSGGNRDPISRLERQAAAHNQRVRGMKQRLMRKKDRKALEAARQRLVAVLRLIAERPEEITTGTHKAITKAMADAQEIYNAAPKTKVRGRRRTQRNGSRPREAKSVRAKNLPPEYTGEDDRNDI